MLEMKQGAVRALGTDGADRVWGFTPVTGTEWYALSSVSANRVFGPMQQRMLESAVLLVMVLCAASAAVFFSIARLVRPMRAFSFPCCFNETPCLRKQRTSAGAR